ncbi:uncharacterized protein LOC136086350 [Hydra vulgaris]|uniref:Uncharacterized protein LOC136086350 n=1 Tax=Hydra vulgaris TaxID=6087 RepID=A0ABM4CS69_HYDVU
MEPTDIKTGEPIITSAPFRTNNQVKLESTDLDGFYETAKLKILENLSSFQQLGVYTIKVKPYIPLDKNLAIKKAIINIKNEDNQCFKWCIARALNPTAKNSERIEFPVSLNQVTLFEKNNHDISVNVYGFEKSVYLLRISKDNDRQHLIDLLLISNGEKRHYCLIKMRIELPNPGSTMQFIHHNRSMRVPFVVYADFESFVKPINTCTPNPNESYTKQYQKHTPSSFCYYIKFFDESFYQSSPVTFTASSETDDVAQIFVDSLQEDIKKICNRINFKKDMIYNHENKKDFNEATECHICGEYLGEDKKLSGGKLSSISNNEEKYISFSREIKVDEYIKEGKKFEVKRELRFLDSYRFMLFSLDSLSKNLSKEQFKNIRKLYSGKQFEEFSMDSKNLKKLDLLIKKGVYPYDWVDSVDKFNETQLPTKESFFSKLNDEDISDDDYSHAQNVWNEFHCKTFTDYRDLYNVSDVLLLADVFENFRDVCMKNYKLDPAWYYTSPGLAWDAALKKTIVKLELLSDYDMILMIKKGIRGGISMILNRLGTSNNKYMDNYDQTEPSTYIQYLDANNLYGWAMSKPLPTHGFKWMDEDELKNWKSIPCILEVDLNYPEHLHDDHNDYSLAPEMITKIHRGVMFEERAWLSQYIELNTNLRTKATNDSEKEFFKLMNNSVFGKTMENIENRVDVRLVTNRDEAVKLASRPNYESRTIFNENLIAIHMKKTKLMYNKPTYLGMCILDLSKTLMYEFHYDYIKKKYADQAKLLFTDTDSLTYEIKTEDFYDDIKNDIESKFDTSVFNPNHPAINNKVGFKVVLIKK